MLELPEVSLQSMFAPILQSQAELVRLREAEAQLAELEVFLVDHQVHQASGQVAQIRQQFRAIKVQLKLKTTSEMVQLANRLRTFFPQWNRIPVVELDFR